MFVCACVCIFFVRLCIYAACVSVYMCVRACLACSSRYPPVAPRALSARAGTEASWPAALGQEATVLRISEPPPGRNTYLERLNTFDTLFMSDTLIKSNIQTVHNKGSEVHQSNSISVGRAKGVCLLPVYLNIISNTICSCQSAIITIYNHVSTWWQSLLDARSPAARARLPGRLKELSPGWFWRTLKRFIVQPWQN